MGCCRTPSGVGIDRQANELKMDQQVPYPNWVQQNLLDEEHVVHHESVQTTWPLDAEATYGVLPTPRRLHADPRFLGRGQTIAMIDAGYYPHPDLTQPVNRIRAWVDASTEHVQTIGFPADTFPQWPGWRDARPGQWHGLMTSVAAAGNGFMSHGLYRGMAPEAGVVLIRTQDRRGRITDNSIIRALNWVLSEGKHFGVTVVNLSVAGDTQGYAGHPIDEAIGRLAKANVVVVAAAGNNGVRRLIPPATAPGALTIGGIDDKNTFDRDDDTLWHSNYGHASNGVSKPELVAPSIWVAAPILPDTPTAREARYLFENRTPINERRIAELKLISPYYQHVDGTSFAAPIVASTVACMLEANHTLTPLLVRDVLRVTSFKVPGVSRERQGAGALDAGKAVARALEEHHKVAIISPDIGPNGVSFALHDHHAHSLVVYGSWNGWQHALVGRNVEHGVWKTPHTFLPHGVHQYKFVVDGHRWLDDPANPRKHPDGFGGLNSVLMIH